MDQKQLTTAAGRLVGDNQNSLTVGPRGPIIFEDFLLFEKMAHFNRERVPERVVHAKGSGAYGSFGCTNPARPMYTTARLFSAVGKRTPTFLRFSTVGGEKGSADTERDPRGFALQFYTEEGNWDRGPARSAPVHVAGTVPSLFSWCLTLRGALDRDAQQPFCDASFLLWAARITASTSRASVSRRLRSPAKARRWPRPSESGEVQSHQRYMQPGGAV